MLILVKPGVRYRDVGNVIQKHAQNNGFSVVRSYCGHGIHRLFHCAPSIPHYASKLFTTIQLAGTVLMNIYIQIQFIFYI